LGCAEAIQVTGLDALGLEVAVEVLGADADHAADAVGGQIAVVDQPINGAGHHREPCRDRRYAEPTTPIMLIWNRFK
jgi:hypothetical protein